MNFLQLLTPYISEAVFSQLSRLLSDLGKTNLSLNGLVTDNRDVSEGDCFIALSGITQHGKVFVDDAISRGAIAILVEDDTQLYEQSGVPVICLSDLKNILNPLLINYYQSELHLGASFGMRLLGITGTNGKSSITRFVAQMSHALNQPAGLMGTLGFGTWPHIKESKNTTPELAVLLRQFALMNKQGSELVAMEVSSHGIEQKRIEGLVFDSAVFSNLTQDHLDYHGDMESYFRIKRSLFLMPELKFAIINADDEYGQRLLSDGQILAKKISYGFSADADVRITQWQMNPASMDAMIDTPWGSASFSIDMVGDFNLANVLAAIALLAVEEKFKFNDIINAIQAISSAPGRMQAYQKQGSAAAVVDFAHTPDALKNVLKTLKKQTGNKLAVVFGCGGDRDTTKRPQMAGIAEQYADLVCLTADNPRTENLDTIIEQMKLGIKAPSRREILIEKDRALAIEKTLSALTEMDLLLIAGKGHEAYQDIAGEKIAYSDESVLFALGYSNINRTDSSENKEALL